MHTASDVAKWFLCHNQILMDSSGGDQISNLKLQKLLYYAQGAFLAIKGVPLFPDKIMAWMHGPVVPDVYHEYKGYGDAGIAPPETFDPDMFSDEESELLTEVYNEFAQYSAWKLRNMTHQETPWQETPQNEEIDPEKIKEYFKSHYVA